MNSKSLFFVLLMGISFSSVVSQPLLSLSEVIEIALDNNYGIIISKNQLAVSGINNSPGSAGMLPRLDATGSRNYQVNNTYQQFFDGRIRESDNAKSNSMATGLQLNWTFFDGFNMFVRRNKLEEMQRLDETQLRIQVENTIADVIISYHNIVIQKQMVELFKEAMDISAQRRMFAEAKYRVGTENELAFLQASVDFNADSAAWLSQIMALGNAKTEMNKLLSRDLSEDFSTLDEISLRPDLHHDYLLSRAMELNPELQAARIGQTIASLNIRESLSLLYPRLNLSTGYNYSRSVSEVGLLERNRNYGYFAGLSLSYNIFNGFNTRREIQIARINEETAQVRIEQTELNIAARVKELFNDYMTNLQLVNLERENRVLADKNFRIAEEKYRLGSLTDFELRETQNKMMDAEVRYFLARYRGKIAETELLLLSGELLL